MNVQTLDRHTRHKAAIAAVRGAMYDFSEVPVRAALADLLAPDAVAKFAYPLGESIGSGALYDGVYRALFKAVPDLERRDYIVMAGPTPEGADWVGCGGYYTGTFQGPWLDIPPTQHIFHLRFHEFFRFDDERVTEIQALWDIPEVMLQASAWPMAPSLGREWHVPAPATQDGLVPGPYDPAQGTVTCQTIIDMLSYLQRYPSQGGPEVMQMPRFWHERMSWYGPAGIGTGRRIQGFRDWHQIPFLNGMPDRGRYEDEITCHFFADRQYAAVTGWPDMIQTITDDGWLGIAPSGQRVSMRSLDFWRLEDGRIRENWVLVDLLDVYHQLGIDVFHRMREFNKARAGFDPQTGIALT